MMLIRFVVLLLSCLIISSASAHKNSDSYLNLNVSDNRISVQWDIALKDLDHLIGLDRDGDGKLSWAEVKSKHSEIAALALNRLTISGDKNQCSFGNVEHLVNRHSGYGYAVLRTVATCAQAPSTLTVNYNFLFDRDSQHKGLMSLTIDGKKSLTVFSPDNRQSSFEITGNVQPRFSVFFVKGIEHLLGGIDHLLFLFVLLLPAILMYGTYRNNRESGLKETFIEVVKILTAFTIAHAITLTLSVLGLVSLPATPVEIVIAVSVGIAALDNIWPFLGRHRWAIAGGFGLIHGFGFANALGPLNLSSDALFTALLAFNLGLEAAQVLIAAILLPIGYIIFQDKVRLAKLGLHGGSAFAIAIAALWTIDRSMGLEMMPF